MTRELLDHTNIPTPSKIKKQLVTIPCQLNACTFSHTAFHLQASNLGNVRRRGSGFNTRRTCCKCFSINNDLEARVGIEPTNAAFAEPCLTTWLPRHRFQFINVSASEFRSLAARPVSVQATAPDL